MTPVLKVVAPADTGESYIKEVNQTMNLKTMYSHLSADQIIKLETIAEMCPTKYGQAVYSARVILAQIDTITREYKNDCEFVPPPENNGRHSAPHFINPVPLNNLLYIGKVFPNPNTGEMSIDYILQENDVATLTISDGVGKIIAIYSLPPKQNRFNIDISGVANGIYFYSVSVNERLVGTNKFAVIK